MPDQTIDATRDHGMAKRTVDVDVDKAVEEIKEIKAAGVDVENIVLHQLVDEGVSRSRSPTRTCWTRSRKGLPAGGGG